MSDLQKLIKETDVQHYEKIQSLADDNKTELINETPREKRLYKYMKVLAKSMQKTYPDELSESKIEDLSKAAKLYDIGKEAIPDAVLNKKEKLTNEEFDLIKQHTVLGAMMIESMPKDKNLNQSLLNQVKELSLTHHERCDGTGYPNNLTEKDIPLSGKIMSIIDIYDALRADKPYREGMNHETALDIILNGDGRTEPKHFDENILLSFKGIAHKFNEIRTSTPNKTNIAQKTKSKKPPTP